VKLTVPVKLFKGATVNVTGGIVPPDETATVALVLLTEMVALLVFVPLGVTEKSAHVPDVTVTISGFVMIEPFVEKPELVGWPAGSAGPFDPVYVASPE
jgi:hypothetical protein